LYKLQQLIIFIWRGLKTADYSGLLFIQLSKHPLILPVEIVDKLIILYSLTQLTHNIFVFYIHVNIIIAMCIQFIG